MAHNHRSGNFHILGSFISQEFSLKKSHRVAGYTKKQPYVMIVAEQAKPSKTAQWSGITAMNN
jgi:hypothetical protein